MRGTLKLNFALRLEKNLLLPSPLKKRAVTD
jgi:hypothetical protein